MTENSQADAIKLAVEALRPFADIGISENPDYQPMIRMDRDAILAARAALTALQSASGANSSPDALVAAAYEAAARAAAHSHLVPPDGGSPTEDERQVAENASAAIRALTAADARAQLDAIMRRARNEGIEAAKQAMLASAAGLCLGALQTVGIADAADALKTKD